MTETILVEQATIDVTELQRIVGTDVAEILPEGLISSPYSELWSAAEQPPESGDPQNRVTKPHELTGEQATAYLELYTSYEPMISRFVQSRIPDSGTVEEIIAAVMVGGVRLVTEPALLKDMETKGREYVIRNYLLKAAVYRIYDHNNKGEQAKLKKAGITLVPLDSLVDQPVPDISPGPESIVIEALSNKRLTEFLKHILNKKEYEIVYSRVIDGISAQECADVIGSTPGAVRVAQHRALQKIRTAIEAKSKNTDTDPYGMSDLVDSDAEIAHDSSHELIDKFLQRVLKDNQKQIVYLRVLLGLSAEVCGELMGMRPGTVRVIEHRALNRILTALSVIKKSNPDAYRLISIKLAHNHKLSV